MNSMSPPAPIVPVLSPEDPKYVQYQDALHKAKLALIAANDALLQTVPLKSSHYQYRVDYEAALSQHTTRRAKLIAINIELKAMSELIKCPPWEIHDCGIYLYINRKGQHNYITIVYRPNKARADAEKICKMLNDQDREERDPD